MKWRAADYIHLAAWTIWGLGLAYYIVFIVLNWPA